MMINTNPDIENTMIAQVLDAPRKSRKCFISKIILILILLLLNHLASAANIVTVGPAGDANCQFNTIQQAIDSITVDKDIRVSNQLVTNALVEILQPSVSYLRGGYANCADASNGNLDFTNPLTALGNSILILNVDSVDFSNDINIENFIIENIPSQAIKIDAFSHNMTVNFIHMKISHNGGHGIHIRGGAIVNLDYVEINHNNAQLFGGGVECVDAALTINEHVSIHHNYAPKGGGIDLYNCTFTMNAGDSNSLGSLEYGLYSNLANEGAGIYIYKSNNVNLLGTTAHPVSIVNNGDDTTTFKGGGIYVGDSSAVQIVNVRLDNNVSKISGAGIYATYDIAQINNSAPTISISRHTEGCTYNEICNSLNANQTIDSTNDGAVAYLENGSKLYLYQSEIKNNSAFQSNLFKVKANSEITLVSNLIINNNNALELVNQENDSVVLMYYSTLANNQFDNYFNVLYDNNIPQTLYVRGSIIKNGSSTIARLNNDMGNHDAQIICSLVENDDGSGIVQNGSVIGVPTFAGSGSYQLQEDSLGLDSTCMNFAHTGYINLDILNIERTTSPTPDLGAYQMGYLFHDGFE